MKKYDAKDKPKKIYEFEIFAKENDNFVLKKIELQAETEKKAWELLPYKIFEKYKVSDWIYAGKFNVKTIT